MSETMKQFLGSIVRWALTFAFAGLATHKVVDGPLLGLAINDLTAQIVGGIGVAGTLGLSWLDKWRTAHREKVALAMPPGSDVAQLDAVVKTVSPGILPTGPIPSPAKVAAIVEGVKA